MQLTRKDPPLPMGMCTFLSCKLFDYSPLCTFCVIDLKTVVQQCADPEDVDETLTALAKSKAKKLADFSAMTAKDLEDTISSIAPAIKSKLRDALSPYIKQGIFNLIV